MTQVRPLPPASNRPSHRQRPGPGKPRHDGAALSVLFVCTGNICRSPMAERLLHDRLVSTVAAAGSAASVTVASAGTRAVVGWPMDDAAAAVLRELGGDAEGHIARQLTPDLLRGADLVLTASTAHRARVLRDSPALMRRAFTIREFARLAAEVDAAAADAEREVLLETIRIVADQRGQVAPVDPAEDEIGDPFGASLDVMRACGVQIREAIDDIARLLGAPPRA